MKLAFLADGRSPIAINWIRWLVEQGHEVHWISSRPAAPPLAGLASFRVLPVFPELPSGVKVSRGRRFLHPAATLVRHWWMPFRLGARASQLNRWMAEIRPDLLHAMRIPQEGMVAAQAKLYHGFCRSLPLLISVWGDDFTYHAKSSPMMAELTKAAMRKADALHADCRRDIRLAFSWGLRIDTMTMVEPGNGGIRIDEFCSGDAENELIKKWSLPKTAFFILNPRGIRGVARTDTFFRAIPLVKEKLPNVHFLALKMAEKNEAADWVRRLGIREYITLLPPLSMEEMPPLYRLAPVMLSLTTHDGLPNVLLEAMACGCYPVCGDVESLREWIDDGRNGSLVPPGDPQTVAGALVRVAKDAALRMRAAERNREIIAKRAEWHGVMGRVEEFYRAMVT
ncbi:MAG: glycosyltransferase family 4 protein [Anaerolineales bacterium]|nr:glycosyltransferase family 4 protein [Anaerolineales bacterium]